MTDWWLVILVAVGGGLGAVLRYLVDARVQRWATGRAPRVGSEALPWGLIVVNVSGSAAAGALIALSVALGGPWWATVCLSGVLGGYTTLSTASRETARAVRARSWAAVVCVAPVQLVLACAAAAAAAAAWAAVIAVV